MNIDKFIEMYKEAFGNYELPVAVWYSESPAGEILKSKGCFMHNLKPARDGGVVSFDVDAIYCPGGKLYCGFIEMPEFIPPYVSLKERYKDVPEQMIDFVKGLELIDMSGKYLNFASITQIDNFESAEGLVFFANPDVMSGLVSWVHFDHNRDDAVCVPFASGCSATVAQTITENRRNGYKTYLGMFDPSVRPQVEADIISLSVPMSRFKEMYHTFNESCLQGTHGWKNVRKRITGNED